jgi:hypothetical protein
MDQGGVVSGAMSLVQEQTTTPNNTTQIVLGSIKAVHSSFRPLDCLEDVYAMQQIPSTTICVIYYQQ